MSSRPRSQVSRPRRRGRLSLPRRSLEWGLAIVALALVAIAIAALGGGSSTSSAASKRTATVGRGVVQSTVSGNGTLEPAQKVELSFGASGEVTAIDVKAGEKVKKGQVLARVDSSSARATLASAEAALVEAEESVEAAGEAEAEEVAYEGGAHAVLVDLTTTESSPAPAEATAAPEEVPAEEPAAGVESSAREEVEKAKEEARKAREEAKRAKEEARRAAAATPKEGESAPASGESPATGESPTSAESATSVESPSSGSAAAGSATVSLATAEANLREAELSVESARQEVRETTLRAPISGTIAEVSGSVGESVSGGSSGGGTSESVSPGATGGESSGSASGSAFIVLAQLHRLKMEVSFSEADIGKVRKGQAATVAIDSMEGTELAGEVTKVSVLPTETGSVVEYPATILLAQSAKGVRAGMSASAEVVVEQVKNAVTVSTEAVSGNSVTVEEDGKDVTKSVKTGLEGDETTEIISGLEVGQTVVLPEATVAAGVAGGSESSAGLPGGFPGVGSGGFSGGPPSGVGFPGGAP